MLFLSFLLLSSRSHALPNPNPLHKRDPNFAILNGANFPDPSIINEGGRTYIFGTGGDDNAGPQIPFSSTTDFNNPSSWAPIKNAFPAANVPSFGPGGWAVVGSVWAPDINKLVDGDGTFALYYSAALKSNPAVHCVGLARSRNIEGPYNDSSNQPWICPQAQGGAIDAAGFLDSDGKRYVVYKVDGPAAANGGYCANPNNRPRTPIMLQQTTNDGYTKIGDPIQLLDNLGVPESFQSEAPGIVRSSDGVYFLFFSTGCYDKNSYTLRYVTSTNGVRGPYGQREVLLKTGDFGEFGPGSADFSFYGGQAVWHSLKDSNSIAGGRVCNTGHYELSGRTARIL